MDGSSLRNRSIRDRSSSLVISMAALIDCSRNINTRASASAKVACLSSSQGVKQGSQSSGVFVGPFGEGQHDVSAAHHGGMGDKSIIGSTLALFGKIGKRLGNLEEHLDIPSAPIGRDDLLVAQSGIGGQQGQPLFVRLSRTNTIFARTGIPLSFSPISTMIEARIFARPRRLRIFL